MTGVPSPPTGEPGDPGGHDTGPATGGTGEKGPATGDKGADGSPSFGGWAPNDQPSAVELLDAVEEFLREHVVPGTEGRLRFHARVAANVVATVAREIALGPGRALDHSRRLASLGLASEAQLAAAIRSGALDDRLEEVRAVVAATVADKLAVSNPRYLDAPSSPGAERP